MAHYNFRKDIIEGEAGESFVTNWLCENANGTLVSDNKTNSHDILIQFPDRKHDLWSGAKLLEIKTDVYITPERDTGNMFIEYSCRGKPSGVMVTKADIFITYFKNLDELWAITTDDLKKLLATYTFRDVNNAGDSGSKTSGYLIPRNKYREYFKRYKV